MMMHGYNWFGRGFCPIGFGGYFGIWHFVVLIGVILLVVGLVRMIAKRRPSGEDAIETLKQLYVNGEISDEEYLKRKSVIERK